MRSEQWDAHEIAQLEQEIFKQRKRIADGERALQAKPTKKAAEDVRIGTNKVEQAMGRLDALKRSESQSDDSRIYPGYYCPVMVWENGRRVVKPMRYQCRMPGWTEVVERKFPGTYNARRDKLEIVVGQAVRLQPWRHAGHGVLRARRPGWPGRHPGVQAIDGPGHARRVPVVAVRRCSRVLSCCPSLPSPTIRRPRSRRLDTIGASSRSSPENVDAWLNPDPKNLAAQYAILDDRERPYYEHRKAA